MGRSPVIGRQLPMQLQVMMPNPLEVHNIRPSWLSATNRRSHSSHLHLLLMVSHEMKMLNNHQSWMLVTVEILQVWWWFVGLTSFLLISGYLSTLTH
jgi:hypothetical protein